MDTRLDPLTEPMRCAHGREFVVLQDEVVWLTPCATCARQNTVADASAVAA